MYCVNKCIGYSRVVIRSFADKTTADLYHGVSSRDARRIPKTVWSVAQRKLDMIHRATSLTDLRVPPANRLEKLKGDLSGFHSIRINAQYRVTFRFVSGDAHDVAVTDYH